MTSEDLKTIVCACCGKHSEHWVLSSTNSSGSADLGTYCRRMKDGAQVNSIVFDSSTVIHFVDTKSRCGSGCKLLISLALLCAMHGPAPAPRFPRVLSVGAARNIHA
jgi:hypothetical protein